jgi:catechol 2,3-dioxygenase-like lactoylglutathione lyase family enzyme
MNAVANTTTIANERAELEARRDARHRKNKVRRLHHHAIRTKDMQATRAFYEGILGLPLVGTWKEGYDPIRKKPSPYLHCFYELGDGSALAFFLFEDREAPPLMPQDPFDHHISLCVGDIPDLVSLRDKFIAAGHRYAVIDHGYCYSLYTRDPNGLLVELTVDPDDGLQINEEAAAIADQELTKWLAGDHSVNNTLRDKACPIPTSTLEEVHEVTAPRDRHNSGPA